jgi:dipeptidyl-peptidase 4
MQKNNKLAILSIFLLFCSLSANSQSTGTRPITVEDIWGKYTFRAKSVQGFNFLKDGKHYTTFNGTNISKYLLSTGEKTGVIFDTSMIKESPMPINTFEGFDFSEDENKILLSAGTEQIYRRSTKGFFYIWDREKKSLRQLFQGTQSNPDFNSQATHVAFTSGNNLYINDLANDNVKQITTDGKWNYILNGMCDWVYEEEFAFTKAFQWSPDGTKIAFLRFDESDVKEYTLEQYTNEAYPHKQSFKYPKVGEKNAIVSVFIYDLKTDKLIPVKLGTDPAVTEFYIPRIIWTNDNQLCITKMNRHQNELDLLLADSNTGNVKTLLHETSKYYIDIHDHLTFLKDNKHFLWTSEKDGYNHLYLYDMNGKIVRQLTQGNYEITKFYGIDQKKGNIYYQTNEMSPLERYVFQVDLKGNNKRSLAGTRGLNDVQFSTTYDYYVLNHSSINSPASFAVYETKTNELVRNLEENKSLKETQKAFGVVPIEFFKFATTEGTELNGWIMKPANMDSTKKHPLFMTQYRQSASHRQLERSRLLVVPNVGAKRICSCLHRPTGNRSKGTRV